MKLPPSPWSFLREVLEREPGRRLSARIFFAREELASLGLSPTSRGGVPESLLIECCAQAAGLCLLLEEGARESLPVLARVNEARFGGALAPGNWARVEVKLIHQTENGAEFEGQIHLENASQLLLQVRFILGFTSLSELPDQGQLLSSRMADLKRQMN